VQAFDAGLSGVVVAETRLSDVDGEGGHLTIAGHDAENLAGRVCYEAVLGMLLAAAGGPETSEADLRRRLGEARVRAFAAEGFLAAGAVPRDGAAAVRAAMATREAADGGGGDVIGEVTDVVGAVAVAAAAFARRHAGAAPIAPDPTADHATDLLRMAIGGAPSRAAALALGGYLATVSDHGMNASTFTARVVASTGSDLVSAIVAAVGALKGPLHGGAPGPVLDMLDALGTPDNARSWLQKELAAGRRIMGMGHRIYRARDPRAAILERLARTLEFPAVEARLELARAVESEAEILLAAKKPERPLKANVEFYTAVLLDALGLDRAVFTPIFAAGRAAGWCAHVIEQRKTARLVRPASRYVGIVPGLAPLSATTSALL